MGRKQTEKYKILIVDDNDVWLDLIRHCLEDEFIVYTASLIKKANRLMLSKRFDCVLLDVNLQQDATGIELAEWYKDLSPNTAVILFTCSPAEYYKAGETKADACLEKTISIETLKEAILNIIWLKNTPQSIRRRRFSALQSILIHQKAIKLINQVGDSTGAERLEGILMDDKKPIAWDVYNVPSDRARNIISLASTVGCVGRCKMCLSGLRPFERQLSKSEIIAQFLHSLKSYHLKGVFDGGKKIVVNFTTEGDSVSSNLDNCCQAVELIAGLKKLDLAFIMTTIGHEKNLERFLKEYSHLPIAFYWSVNFLDPAKRAELMPATQSQSLARLRDIFQKIAEKTGKTVTASWILIKDRNDAESDVDQLKNYFYGRPFEIKVMGLEEESLFGVPKTTAQDIDRFVEMLNKAGLPCRKREIVGGRIKAGCGTTIPVDISYL